MNWSKACIRSLFLLAAFFGVVQASVAKSSPSLIVVDKKTNLLYLAEYQSDDSFKVLQTFHTTTGKVKGDKEEEGDLKTPEGVYQFKTKILQPPHPKFGTMAVTLNYPNAYDLIAGRTGTNIWLHGTNYPERLKLDFDSEGCVVLANEDLMKVVPWIRLGLTPILIFEELKPEYMNGSRSEKLHKFFESWITSWENKEIEAYIGHYHTDFVGQGKDRLQWKNYKNSLNKRYAKIKVGNSSPYFFRHPKYTMMMFTQDYVSSFSNGKPAMKSRGTKILYIAEESGEPKIVAENFTEQLW